MRLYNTHDDVVLHYDGRPYSLPSAVVTQVPDEVGRFILRTRASKGLDGIVEVTAAGGEALRAEIAKAETAYLSHLEDSHKRSLGHARLAGDQPGERHDTLKRKIEEQKDFMVSLEKQHDGERAKEERNRQKREARKAKRAAEPGKAEAPRRTLKEILSGKKKTQKTDTTEQTGSN